MPSPRLPVGLIAAALCVPACATASPPMTAETPRTPAFQQLVDAIWQWRLREFPTFATYVGDTRYDDRLADASLEASDRRAAEMRAFIARLKAFEPASLQPRERVDHAILLRQLTEDVDEHRFGTHLMPVSQRGGFHVRLLDLPDVQPLATSEDFRRYIARLEAVLPYTRQHIERMRVGMKRGIVPPRVVMTGAEDVVAPHVVKDPTKSVLYAPFVSMPATVPEAQREALRAAARKAITESVVPGFRELHTFLKDAYIPACRDTIAASALPDGEAFYDHRVKRYTTLPMTAQEVHDIGLAEVKRIREDMDAIIDRVGFEGDFAAFVAFLRTDPQFYVDTPTALMEKVALVLKRMDGALPKLFGKLPRTPYGIKPVPDYLAPRTTTAYYMPPSGEGASRTAGFYFVNTYDLKSRPLYELEALSLHEAVPGHHLQIALQQELDHLHPFRRYAMFTAFVEGWGLYAERLGLEVGFYEDPYQDFGRLTYEMWRACRLVVDTGMHALGWSRQRAIDYMAQHTALSLHNIETEVDRYISWPGQALAYKIGQLEILRLRRDSEKALGARFDVRAFHDVVLGEGAVPLDVLRRQVEAWRARVASDTEGATSHRLSP